MPIRSRTSTIQRAVQKNNNGTLTHAHSLDRSLAPGGAAPRRLAAGRTIRFGCSARPGADEALLYYQRADGDFSNCWGPHLWNTADCNGSATETSWTQPLAAAGTDPEHGALYRIPLSADASCLNLIMHKGDEGSGQYRHGLALRRTGPSRLHGQRQPAIVQHANKRQRRGDQGRPCALADPFTLALVGGAPGASRVELRYAHDASIRIDSEARTVSGGQALAMQPASLRNGLRRQHPHLADARRTGSRPAHMPCVAP